MAFYLINSDRNARKDMATCDLWFDCKKAFAGDFEGNEGEHSVFFENKLNLHDVLFMYHSKIGCVGAGIVLAPWDRKSYQGDQRILYQNEKYEYRVEVDWIHDWRNSPKGGVHGLPVPRGRSWQRIDEARYPSVLIYAAGCTIEALEDYEKRFEKSLIESKSDSDELRKKRLEEANPNPPIITVITRVFQRNPDVVIEVLKRAKGVCEECRKPAPFARRSDGTQYLEVHHIKMLSDGGLDKTENAKALCPNCHRQAHHG